MRFKCITIVVLISLSIVAVFLRPGSVWISFDMRSLGGTNLESVVALANTALLTSLGQRTPATRTSDHSDLGSRHQQTVVTQTVVTQTQTVVTNLDVQEHHAHSKDNSTFQSPPSAVVANLLQQHQVAIPNDQDNPRNGSSPPLAVVANPDNQDVNGVASIVAETTQTTTSVPYFNASDWDQFVKWKQRVRFGGDKPPRTLMYTWCTEDTFDKFQNEVYWKSCYAHLHGFDIVFSDKMNFSGVAKYRGGGGSAFEAWYSEENMWAWWSDIQLYLKSGKYDYVFMMGADVLLQGVWFHWPVWAWDRGHSVTVMDQHAFPYLQSYGLNENNILFRASNYSLRFIKEVFAFRKGFHLQGDNGPYMEGILRILGRQAKAKGRKGYDNECYPILKIDKPSSVIMLTTTGWWAPRNDQYDKCFFRNLDRLAGSYGYRNSKGIGFYPTFIGFNGQAVLPMSYLPGTRHPHVPPKHPHARLLPLGPWANCWSSVRSFWSKPHMNCFAYHWNGPKDPAMHGTVSGGSCPDPNFDWATNPYNPKNRRRQN